MGSYWRSCSLSKKYKRDDAVGAVVSALIGLVEELADVEVEMSKMCVQTALIHPVIRSITKSKKVVPYKYVFDCER